MLETTNTGVGDGGAYTFNSHREALYKILEATVTEQAGASSSRGKTSSGLRFLSPFLWYDEIRPADIDAYHAANEHDRIMCIRSSKVDASSLSDEGIFGSREEGRDLDRSREALDDAAVAVEGRAAVGEHGLVPRTCVAQDCMAGAAAEPVEKEVLDLKQTRLCLAAPRSSKDWGLEEAKSVMRPDRCTGAVSGLSSSSTKLSSHPHGRAGVQQQERERRKDADGNNCYSSQNRENICSSPAIPPSITTTPPDPSQATQALFLPGLPSQVLVTQPQTDATGWEHPEGHEWSPREEDSALSEHAFFPSALSNPWPSTEEQPPGPRASVESAEGNAPPIGRGLQSASSSKGPYDERSYGSESAAVERGRTAAIDAALEREDARSGLNEDFTHALREQVEGGGNVCAGDSAQSTAAPTGSGRGGSGGSREQSKPSFTFVATTEVLPSGWSGGQAGAVSFLEDQLLLARRRLHDGYAVRALELACHTLRQPKVCVRATEPPGDRLGDPCAAAALRPAGFAGASAPASELPEVVGVPGFVWEILSDAGQNLNPT